MKRLFLSLAACIMLLPVAGYAQEYRMDISPLTGNFYIYTTYKAYQGSPFPSNSMYVVTDSGVVLIDTPWNEEQTLPLLDSIRQRHGKEVVLCIATHHHADRTAGFDVLRRQGIPTWSSAQTREFCKKSGDKQAEFTFRRDTTFHVGGVSFQAFYPGPGHALDNIVVWFPAEKVLYGGCFVKSTEASDLGNIADADLSRWPGALKKVMKKFKRPAFIIPGHQDWSSPESLNHTLELLERNRRRGR